MADWNFVKIYIIFSAMNALRCWITPNYSTLSKKIREKIGKNPDYRLKTNKSNPDIKISHKKNDKLKLKLSKRMVWIPVNNNLMILDSNI